jgi:hypothetical protein
MLPSPVCCHVLHTHAQVKQTSLVQHAVEGLAAKLGQQVSAVVCPWKWPMPWQQQQQRSRQQQL